jgi:hypothetical protein
MNEEIRSYAEMLEQERKRIADGLRGPLQTLGYGLRKVSIGEGQGFVYKAGCPTRATVSVCIFTDEINGNAE